MLYRKYQPGTIKVEPPGVTSDSREVVERLERIEEHYRQLDELLTSIETQMPKAERREAVAAFPAEDADAEDLTPPSQKLRRRKPR